MNALSETLWNLCSQFRQFVREQPKIYQKLRNPQNESWDQHPCFVAFNEFPENFSYLFCYASLEDLPIYQQAFDEFSRRFQQLSHLWEKQIGGQRNELLFLLKAFYGIDFANLHLFSPLNGLPIPSCPFTLCQHYQLSLPTHVLPFDRWLNDFPSTVPFLTQKEPPLPHLAWLLPLNKYYEGALPLAQNILDYDPQSLEKLFPRYRPIPYPQTDPPVPAVVSHIPLRIHRPLPHSLSEKHPHALCSFILQENETLATPEVVLSPPCTLITTQDTFAFFSAHIPLNAPKSKIFWNLQEDAPYAQSRRMIPTRVCPLPPYVFFDKPNPNILLPPRSKVKTFCITPNTLSFDVPPTPISLTAKRILNKWQPLHLLPVFEAKTEEDPLPQWYTLLWKGVDWKDEAQDDLLFTGCQGALYRVGLRILPDTPQNQGMACAGPAGAVKHIAHLAETLCVLAIALPLRLLRYAHSPGVFFHQNPSIVIAAYAVTKHSAEGELSLKLLQGIDCFAWIQEKKEAEDVHVVQSPS